MEFVDISYYLPPFRETSVLGTYWLDSVRHRGLGGGILINVTGCLKVADVIFAAVFLIKEECWVAASGHKAASVY
jgi:hypothetical protein